MVGGLEAIANRNSRYQSKETFVASHEKVYLEWGELFDMHLSTKELNVLGQITQKGWGVSSMPNPVICSIAGDTITLKYMTVVHFAAEAALKAQAGRVSDESISILKGCVDDLKQKFKEACGRSLSLKEMSNKDSLEVIVATNNSSRRVAYYRRQVTLQVM